MALPSGEIFPGLPRLGLLLLLLDRSQTSGGRCGAPAGSAKVSGEARDAILARPRLLSRLPDDRREGGERESSPAPKRPKFSCPNVCVLSVHSIKMHTFSQKELSPPHSINAVPLAPPQCSAGPHPTQVIAAHPTTEQLKPLRQFISAWKVIPGISRWLLNVIERGYTLQFRRRPPRFNGVVQSLTSPRNAQALRQEIGCLLEKGAVERVPPHELESGFYSRYFVVPKRDGGLRPILDLRPINRALCERQFRMVTLKQILAQIHPGDWFASVDLKDAYFHIQIAPHHRRFLRFAFENTAYQYSVLPFGLALAPRTFSKCVDAALSPLRAGGMRILNYLDDWLILAQSRDTLLSHIDSLLIHLESLGLCVNRRKSILAPSQSILYLGVCIDSLEMRARLSRERVAAILSYLRHFREGSSVHLKEFQRLLGLMASASAVCHLGLLHMRPLQLWLKTRVPWTAWTSGRLSIAVTRGCIEALAPWRNPNFFSRGVPLGLVTSRVVVTTDASTLGWGAVCEGMPASGQWSEHRSDAHKPIGIGSSLFSSEGVSSTTGTAACTDSHRQHVCGRVHKSPGRRPFEGVVQAGSDVTAMGGFSPSIHQSNAHPRSFESRGRHAFKEENSSRGMEVTPRVSSDDLEPLRGSRGGFIRYERECTLPVVLLSVPLPVGRGRAHSALADSQALCVSSDQDIASGVMQDQGGASVRHTHSSELAEPALVSGLDRAADSPPLADSGQEGHVISGGRLGVAPEPRTMEPSCVVASGLSGELDALQARVVGTLTEARAPSTRRLYALKWGVFVKWCHQAHIDPVVCTVLDVLSFLQYRLDSGSLPSTLKVYVAAIASFRSPQGGQSIGRDPMVVSFLKGARRLHPPRPPSVPPWDLEVVLRALSQPPFEPLSSVGLKELSLKTALLLALASAKRIGDLHAFSVDSDCIRFGPGDCSVTLRPRMGYVPKSLSTPFKIQTVSLSALSSESAASSEADAQTSVCPVRALRIYIDRSASFRQSNQLFVCYGGCARGRAVSKQRLFHWIVDAITAAYTNQGLECPLHIRGHSTRAMASSWAWSRGMSIQDICVAAGWSSENTFARFYRLDVQSFASQVLSVSGWCMFTTLFALHTLTNTVVLPCAQCRFLYCVVLSSDTFIMLGWGHAIQSVQFLMLVVQVALFQRSQRYFYPDMQICIPLG